MDDITDTEIVVALARVQQAQMNDEVPPIEHQQLLHRVSADAMDRAIETVNTN